MVMHMHMHMHMHMSMHMCMCNMCMSCVACYQVVYTVCVGIKGCASYPFPYGTYSGEFASETYSGGSARRGRARAVPHHCARSIRMDHSHASWGPLRWEPD